MNAEGVGVGVSVSVAVEDATMDGITDTLPPALAETGTAEATVLVVGNTD